MAGKKGKELTLDVAFGDVTIGDDKASVSLNVSRASLTPSQADKSLCGKRIAGRIISRPPDEDPDQGHLDGMDQEETLDGVFDIKSFNTKRKSISFGLSFQIGSIDIGTLAKFAKRNGSFLVDAIDTLPEKSRGRPKKTEDNGDGEDD